MHPALPRAPSTSAECASERQLEDGWALAGSIPGPLYFQRTHSPRFAEIWPRRGAIETGSSLSCPPRGHLTTDGAFVPSRRAQRRSRVDRTAAGAGRQARGMARARALAPRSRGRRPTPAKRSAGRAKCPPRSRPRGDRPGRSPRSPYLAPARSRALAALATAVLAHARGSALVPLLAAAWPSHRLGPAGVKRRARCPRDPRSSSAGSGAGRSGPGASRGCRPRRGCAGR
jgi:hypothetical protein